MPSWANSRSLPPLMHTSIARPRIRQLTHHKLPVLLHSGAAAQVERVNHVCHVEPCVVKGVPRGTCRKVQSARHLLHKRKTCKGVLQCECVCVCCTCVLCVCMCVCLEGVRCKAQRALQLHDQRKIC